MPIKLAFADWLLLIPLRVIFMHNVIYIFFDEAVGNP